MAEENTSNSVLTFILIFMFGFFFSKLMPDICRSMTENGIITNLELFSNLPDNNKINGLIQGFRVSAQDLPITQCKR